MSSRRHHGPPRVLPEAYPVKRRRPAVNAYTTERYRATVARKRSGQRLSIEALRDAMERAGLYDGIIRTKVQMNTDAAKVIAELQMAGYVVRPGRRGELT